MNAPACPDHGGFWVLGETPEKQRAALAEWPGCEECVSPSPDIAGPSRAELTEAARAVVVLAACSVGGLIGVGFVAMWVRDLVGRA